GAWEGQGEGWRLDRAWRPQVVAWQGQVVACHGQGLPLLYTDEASLHLPNGLLVEKAFVDAPDAVVVHPLRPASWGVSLRQQRKSMFNALLYKKHPRLYREKIQAAPPWHYYGIVGALLALLVGVGGKNKP